MTTPERWARADAILQDALDLPEEERAALLSQACGADDALRGEVLALLEADGKAGTFLSVSETSGAAVRWPRARRLG